MNMVPGMLLLVMSGAAAHAQSPMTVASTVEAGWTSNATETIGGRPDLYVRHGHDMEIKGTLGSLSLRGGLNFEQMRHATLAGENDISIGGGMEMGAVLGEGVALRAGFAPTWSSLGEMVDIGGVPLTLTSPEWEHEALAELVMVGDARQVTIGMDGLLRLPGATAFDLAGLDPIHLDPDVALITARVDGELALNSELALLGRLHGFSTSVSYEDQVEFGREPANGARLAAGVRVKTGDVSFEGRAGFDLVWPRNAPRFANYLPYFDVSTSVQALERLVLTARARTGLELVSPIDGVAGATMDAELGAHLGIGEQVRLGATLGLKRETGIYDASLVKVRRMAGVSLAYQAAAGTEIGIKAHVSAVEEPIGAYDIKTVALTFRATL